MAVYRVDRYARTYYGPNPERPTFDEKTFEAYSVGYEGIYLEWEHPAGEYTGFRLLSSRDGYPRTYEDGKVLLEAGPAAPTFFLDNDVLPGRFHYYAIFLEIQGVWLRAGTASTLHIKNYEMVPWFWYRIPIHHRLLQGSNITVDADSNETLYRLITMLGYGMDRVRTSMQAALDNADLRTTHITTVVHRAASLGANIPEGLAAPQARILAQDAAYLASERGHPDAMRAAGRATSGWDVTLRPSYNILPSYDMAEQINPRPPEWDPSIRYLVGDLVTLDFYLYRCVQDAYGLDQAPPGNGSNNTWWQVYSVVDDRTVAYDETYLTQHGWSGVSHSPGVDDNKAVPKIVRGVEHPVTGDRDANALTIHNTHNATANIGVYSLPANPTNDPLINIGHGIILPRIKEWDRERTYHSEDLVHFRGQVWRAVRDTNGEQPGTHPAWVRNSTDRRLRLTLSGYTHQAHGTNQSSVPVVPYITWFDEYGQAIGTTEAKTSPDTRVLDTFTTYTDDALAPLDGRDTEIGGKTWEDIVPGFIRDSYTHGSARPADEGQRCMSVIDYGSANATVAVTLATAPTGNVQQGIVFRVADENNYFRATRSALEKVVAGVVTTLSEYSKTAADGDRLTVIANGNNISVLVNGTQVAAGADSFNSAATKFGIVVEE